jgi:hypothetical protein
MKRLLLAASALAVVVSLAWAQVFTGALTGSELVNITLTNGSGAQIPLGQLTGVAGIGTTAVATGTITATNAVSTLVQTAALTGALTINTPLAPSNGQIFTYSNGTGSALTQTATFTANPAASPAQTVQSGAVATLAAASSAEWQYNTATTTWYRIR